MVYANLTKLVWKDMQIHICTITEFPVCYNTAFVLEKN